MPIKKKRPAEAGRRPGYAISGEAIDKKIIYYRSKCQDIFKLLLFSIAYESRDNLLGKITAVSFS